ncbi:MAG TPA: phytanoyl-CoA dioxygenase family protein [Acidimicrobiales bacterium]|nr:phytanoyl-CoA dioxygenase family protein [Acidimicrobiales bacterium]
MDPVDPPTTVRDEAEALLALDKWGFCVRPGVLSPEKVRSLRETIEAVAAEARQRESRFDTKRVQKVPMVVNLGPEFWALATHDTVWALVAHMLEPGFLLSNLAASICLPHNEGSIKDTEQELHHDEGYVSAPAPPYPVTAVALWLLDDFTPDNGATGIIPGSHLVLGPPPTAADYEQVVPITARAGSVVVWNGRVRHRARENLTPSARVAILAYYCRPWIRTQINFLASDLSPDVLSDAPERLQVLLGMTPSGLGIIHRGIRAHAGRTRPA